MPLFEKHQQTGLRGPRPAFDNFAIAPVRWREPCTKIVVIGNLLFAIITSAQIGLSATLKPSVKVAESNNFQVTGQIKIPCKTVHRTLFYGFDFFTIIRDTYVAKGTICRDVGRNKWVWKFADAQFSKYNSK